MLELKVRGREYFDNNKNEFITTHDSTLTMEHSLYSISKWESKYEKSFFSEGEKTTNEIEFYIKCMAVDCVIDDYTLLSFSKKNYDDINSYIKKGMTATTIKDNGKKSREVVTSEVLYYRMIALQIPFECQHWHINRLLTLISVCVLKNDPGKKMSKNELARDNKAINAARRKRLNTNG